MNRDGGQQTRTHVLEDLELENDMQRWCRLVSESGLLEDSANTAPRLIGVHRQNGDVQGSVVEASHEEQRL